MPTKPIAANATPALPQRRKLTQLEQDALLARQLNEEYNKAHDPPRGAVRDNGRRTRPQQQRRQRTANDDDLDFSQEDDSWAQFVEKDLPDITARAKGSLQETAMKVGSWFSKNVIGEEDPNQPQPQGMNNRNGNSDFTDEQIKQQQKEWSYYQKQKKGPENPERRRFNSFGAQVGEDSLESHGIALHDNENLSDEDEDVPPQLPTREKSVDSNTQNDETNATATPKDKAKVVAQTTFIDTPEGSAKPKWQPVAPEPLNGTPTKINASGQAKIKNPDEDEDFLINSDDEL